MKNILSWPKLFKYKPSISLISVAIWSLIIFGPNTNPCGTPTFQRYAPFTYNTYIRVLQSEIFPLVYGRYTRKHTLKQSQTESHTNTYTHPGPKAHKHTYRHIQIETHTHSSTHKHTQRHKHIHIHRHTDWYKSKHEPGNGGKMNSFRINKNVISQNIS